MKPSVGAVPETTKNKSGHGSLSEVWLCSSTCFVRINGFISLVTVDTKKHKEAVAPSAVVETCIDAV